MAAMPELERLGDALALMFVALERGQADEALERMAHAQPLFRKVYPGAITWAQHAFRDHARQVAEGKAEGRVPFDRRNPWR